VGYEACVSERMIGAGHTRRQRQGDIDPVGQPTPSVHEQWWPGSPDRFGHERLATLTGTVPLASLLLDFDPILRLGDNGVRLETLGLTSAVVVALLTAAYLAGRTPPDHSHPGWAREDGHLRRDDLLFIVLGVVPGAVVGGRMGYVLLHADYYAVHQPAILDAGQGSLELGLAIVLGTITGVYVARLLDAPVGRWLHVAAVPVLAAICLGKVAMALGGSGQGAPSDSPLATAYAGTGPWGSLAPAIPAHPAQLYEAAATGIALGFLVLLLSLGAFRARDGSAFFVGLALWAIGRLAVTFAWRDDPVVGPLRAGGLIALGVAAIAILGVAAARWAGSRARHQAHLAAQGPDWPDPASRPPF
jgi:phosphatidylglycerol---prolipoprotein diacylglyceryl transferase